MFRISGPDGSVLRDYDVEHERRLHLIVAGRSPNTHFLHLHPSQRPDGAWTVSVRLPTNGSYRVFADFTTGGSGGRSASTSPVTTGRAAHPSSAPGMTLRCTGTASGSSSGRPSAAIP